MVNFKQPFKSIKKSVKGLFKPESKAAADKPQALELQTMQSGGLHSRIASQDSANSEPAMESH